VANEGSITRIAASVDVSRRVIDAAIRGGANLLLVHHGMMWGGAQRITGGTYERLRLPTGSQRRGVLLASSPRRTSNLR
jgi:putative NIF3 family GTP cyclohydrolase 1 type 2